MALKFETAQNIATQLNSKFTNGMAATVKGQENEVVASTEIMSFTASELRRLADIADRRKVLFARTGNNVRLVIK